MANAIAAPAAGAVPAATRPAVDPRTGAPEISFRELWSDKKTGFGFADLLDIVNPLQHLPVIGTLYRAITGDRIGLGARLVGGMLYGGPIGMVGEAMLAASEQATGSEPGTKAVAMVESLFGGAKPATRSAAATPAGPAATAQTAAAAAVAPQLPAATSPAAPVPVAVKAATAPPVTATPVQPAASALPAHRAPRAFPAFPGTVPRPAHGIAAPIRPEFGPMRAAPTLPLVPHAPAADGKPATKPTASAAPADAASRRIARTIAAAQRAQAGLLLASINAAPAAAKDAGTGPADPFAAPSFLPPPGPSAAWIGQALEKYRKTQHLPDPGPAAAPVR